MYEYRAEIVHVVDGDTIHANVDLGIDVHVNLTLRLAGIDAPEIRTPEGEAAAVWLSTYLSTLMPLGGHNPVVTIRTVKDRREKYGRYLATLFTPGGVDINAAMVAAGHAVAYDGGKR